MRRNSTPASPLAILLTFNVLLAGIMAPAATADATVPMPGVLKRCDFSADTYVSVGGDGRALSLISSGPRRAVVAKVELLTAEPNTHYSVRLIQTPRPSLTCSPTDPGVTGGSLDTDASGAAATTLQAPALRGATGAWVFIDRPGEFSQTPAEYYTSDFIART